MKSPKHITHVPPPKDARDLLSLHLFKRNALHRRAAWFDDVEMGISGDLEINDLRGFTL